MQWVILGNILLGINVKSAVYRYSYACYSACFLVLHSIIDLRQCLYVTLQVFVMLKMKGAMVTSKVIVQSVFDFTIIVF